MNYLIFYIVVLFFIISIFVFIYTYILYTYIIFLFCSTGIIIIKWKWIMHVIVSTFYFPHLKWKCYKNLSLFYSLRHLSNIVVNERFYSVKLLPAWKIDVNTWFNAARHWIFGLCNFVRIVYINHSLNNTSNLMEFTIPSPTHWCILLPVETSATRRVIMVQNVK